MLPGVIEKLDFPYVHYLHGFSVDDTFPFTASTVTCITIDCTFSTFLLPIFLSFDDSQFLCFDVALAEAVAGRAGQRA